ncbi:hypothetical protein [Flavobacterium phycosphaerae]|uniref:hypothetical protein n=1 Tax=Flavobacterium phycosphaerae TaxID=2697515 RepID=UPI001389472A|nr:hypothetical protein [Flavobacterium phycosphaerae]
MIKYLFILLLSWTTFSQKKDQIEIDGLTIDPKIEQQVKDHIKESKEYGEMNSIIQIYENPLLGEFFENDTLSFSNNDIDKKLIFKSFYYWRNGKLGIDGAFGIFGGNGFHISFTNNEAKVYHMLSSDDFPTYAYNEKDSLIDRLEVPCTETKIILSEIPDKQKKQIIYGYVEFKSDNYYSVSGGYIEGETPPKKKYRNNMRIYFKSGYLEL